MLQSLPDKVPPGAIFWYPTLTHSGSQTETRITIQWTFMKQDFILVGVDSGGTFTDFVAYRNGSFEIHKVPSTPHDPAAAVLKGLQEMNLTHSLKVIHGTTVGTNAFLERKGSRVFLISTEGFEDVVVIGRQNRESLYDPGWHRPPALVEDALRYGIKERISASGEVLVPLTHDELERVRSAIVDKHAEAVAVCLLFSFKNPNHEKAVANALTELKLPVFLSHQCNPEYREYERTVITVLNAYLSGPVGKYLERLGNSLKGSLHVMLSAGGSIPWKRLESNPAATLLSGPAAGVTAAKFLARKAGFNKIITLDMGGTSTDVSLVKESYSITRECHLGGLPIRLPMIDIHTLGAGGGSIARLDTGKALRVGPQSAGADPGPACYGKGGTDATVTDAHVVLGHIIPDMFLGGDFIIHPQHSFEALKTLSKQLGKTIEETAHGIVEVVNTSIERALRRISIERGYDPREFALFAYGGAGGLHACEVAWRLGISKVIHPPHAGVISALGALLSDTLWTFSRSILVSSSDTNSETLNTIADDLLEEGRETLLRDLENLDDSTYSVTLEMRYAGQSYELPVPYPGDLEQAIQRFHKLHEQFHGYSNTTWPTEIVNLLVRVTVPGLQVEFVRSSEIEGDTEKARIQNRIHKNGNTVYLDRRLLPQDLIIRGPAVICDPTSTFLLPDGWEARIDIRGNVIAENISSNPSKLNFR